MTNAMRELAIVEKNLSDEQIKTKAELLLKSKFLPSAIGTVEQAITIILTGREFGLGLMESLRSINVIQGKPAMSAQLMLALCQRTGELEDMKVNETAGKCEVTIKRKGRSEHTYAFSMEDARALGLDTKDNWRKQAKTMLRWRALSGNLRVTFADAICGLYTDDEAEDIIVQKVEAAEALEEKAADKKETLDMSTKTDTVHDFAAEDDLLLKLGAGFIQDKAFYFKYADRTISEIYADKTPGGDPKGKKFLQMVAEKSKNADDRANITKYIELVERPR